MELRHDMLTHGVNVVTAQHEGKRAGLAVAWATQVATDRILVCVGGQSTTRPLILASQAFGVNVLARDQLPIAQRFGSQSSAKVDKFADLPVHAAETGSPLLDECAWTFDCKVESVFNFKGAKLIVGTIVAAEKLREDYEPLIYRQEDY